MESRGDLLTLVLIARVPRAGVEAFHAYEAGVLPLLAEHGGRLLRRLRSVDQCVEVHVVEFPSRASLDAYRADARRATHAQLLADSKAEIELLELTDVPD